LVLDEATGDSELGVGNTVTRRLNQAEADLHQEWIDNDRPLRAITAQMREVAAEASELILKQVQNQSAKVSSQAEAVEITRLLRAAVIVTCS
jgi:hypothetical protein